MHSSSHLTGPQDRRTLPLRSRPPSSSSRLNRMVSAHGLAASIRGSQESDTFDLGGQSGDSIAAVVGAAFSEPLPRPVPSSVEMIRLTLVVGAGKQARQKYAEGAAKIVTNALEACGYDEDRGASCVAECGGSFKLQHDTGKNLKTVVVFPYLEGGSCDGEGDADGTEQAEEGAFLPENSPGYKIAASSSAVFRNMLSARCPSWSEKRGCLESIEALRELVREMDGRLMKGIPLDPAEQSFYDASVDLEEKEAITRTEIASVVDAGQLTASERDQMLKQNAERIATLKGEGRDTARALERRELLEAIAPIPPRRLRHEAAMGRLYKELGPLLQMEANARGRLLTVKETQTLSRKNGILDEIAHLEESSQGWFEDEETFQQRVDICRQRYSAGRKKGKGGLSVTVGSTAKLKAPVSKWVTPGQGGNAVGWSSSKAAKKNKKVGRGGAVFQAMMMDSDSSSDEEEDEQGGREADIQTVSIPADELEHPSAKNIQRSKQNTAKKKRRKKKKRGEDRQVKKTERTEEHSLPSSQRQLRRNNGEKETSFAVQAVTIITQVGIFIWTHVIPLILALLGWAWGLLFGKTKKNKRPGGSAGLRTATPVSLLSLFLICWPDTQSKLDRECF